MLTFLPTPDMILRHMEVPDYPGLYVLGCYERRLTIYSQQVRAINLILTLESRGRLKDIRKRQGSKCKAAVVGDGIAGMTAAAMLSRCHINVDIYEKSGEIGGQEFRQERYVHPHFVEWPYGTDSLADAELPVLNWSADTADKVRETILDGWRALSPGSNGSAGKIVEKTKHQVYAISQSKKTYTLSWTKTSGKEKESGNSTPNEAGTKDYDLVILALGYGAERGYDSIKAIPYWNKINHEEMRSRHGNILVSGHGDGGYTDMLCLATGLTHKKLLITLFRADLPKVKKRLMEIERDLVARPRHERSNYLLEEYGKLMEDPVTADEIAELRRKYEPEKWLTKAIPERFILSSTTETLLNPEASMANRFLIWLFKSYFEYVQHRLEPHKVKYSPGKYTVPDFGTEQLKNFGTIILRHGVDPAIEKLQFYPKELDECRRVLKTRNDLDQTAWPMWPVYGNPKRFMNFSDGTVRGSTPQEKQGLPQLDTLRLVSGVTYQETRSKAGNSSNYTLPDPILDSEGRLQHLEMDLELPIGGTIRMVYVPGGKYKVQPYKRNLSNNTPHDIEADGSPVDIELSGFWIGKYPVTLDQWWAYVEKRKKDRVKFIEEERWKNASEGRQKGLPMTTTSWLDAMEYCRWAGVSLPTEVQWEVAARGWDVKRKYPWGDAHPRDLANYGMRSGTSGVAPVDAYPWGEGPFGTRQQAGNVWEWCLCSYDKDRREIIEGEKKEPNITNESRHRVIRGGCWQSTRERLKVGYPGWNLDANRNEMDGFRVVWIPPPRSSSAATTLESIGKVMKDYDERVKDHMETREVLPTSDDRRRFQVTWLGEKYESQRQSQASTVDDQSQKSPNSSTAPTLLQLPELFEKRHVVLLFGVENHDPATSKNLAALSVDGVGVPELAIAIGELKEDKRQITSDLSSREGDEKFFPEDKDGPLQNNKIIVAFGSGSVNSFVSRLFEEAGHTTQGAETSGEDKNAKPIIPGFEHHSASTPFSDTKFFKSVTETNKADSKEYRILNGAGILVTGTIPNTDNIFVICAGRSGAGTVAATNLLTELLKPGDEHPDWYKDLNLKERHGVLFTVDYTSSGNTLRGGNSEDLDDRPCIPIMKTLKELKRPPNQDPPQNQGSSPT